MEIFSYKVNVYQKDNKTLKLFNCNVTADLMETKGNKRKKTIKIVEAATRGVL